MRASESPIQSYKSKRISSFANLICSSVSGPEALKKTCLHFAILIFSEKLQLFFEIVIKKCEVIVQKSLSEKNYFEKKKFADNFLSFIC